ncbi:MAG TPA: SUMF1/EgtB/PvdO family nonheme iron enzyme, partial [Terriglobales bacterium]|nr:SUMF1/EgtB/PvdO family nonheme iron enzyme [Terriglobales bacterium]
MAFKSALSFRSSRQQEKPEPQEVYSLYGSVRRQTELLAAPLSAEDQMVQSCAEASPAKWHQAHTTWFFETFILSQRVRDYRPFDPRYRDLFNSYYNAVGAQPEKAVRNTFSRPTLEDVQAYRRHVDENMRGLLGEPLEDDLAKLIELGLNHEQQHQELLVTDIKHAFWSNPLRPAYQQAAQPAAAEVAAQRAEAYAGGLVEIGAEDRAFHFDNEAPRHKTYVQPFRLARRPATCGEYLAFMDDRGYQRPELWLSDGWLAVQTNHWNAPLYWEKQGT